MMVLVGGKIAEPGGVPRAGLRGRAGSAGHRPATVGPLRRRVPPDMTRFAMNAFRDRILPRCRGFVLLWLIATAQAVAADGDAPQAKYSPIERMTPARLKAAHDDVLKIGRLRRALPSAPGLNDYRAILHAACRGF